MGVRYVVVVSVEIVTKFFAIKTRASLSHKKQHVGKITLDDICHPGTAPCFLCRTDLLHNLNFTSD